MKPRISLAANGFNDLYQLLDDGELPIDYIKCPLSPHSREEVALARAYRPVVLHCWGPPGYSATWPTIPEPELLRELTATSGTPFVSVHLDPRPEADGLDSPEAAIQRVTAQVAELQATSGKEILIENVPWYPNGDRPRWGSDPDFISNCVRESGAGFLLDLAHARVAAWQRGEEAEAYLSRLPLESAREVHISGPRMAEDGLRDRHMGLQPIDFDLLEFVLDRAPQVELITSEYAGRREKTIPYGENDGPERYHEDLLRLDAVRRAPRRNLAYRSATDHDFEALLALRANAMRPSLELLGRFDLERMRERLRASYQPEQMQVFSVGEALVGFYMVQSEVDHAYLQHLYVHPDWQSEGIGRTVLRRIFRETEGRPLRLRAFRGSPSNRFYVRHGFRLVAEEEWDMLYERIDGS